MTSARALPPVWFMGLTNLLFGFLGGVVLITTPQLMAARHVAEPIIARVTSLAMVPYFAGFLLSPLLDVYFSRRTYAYAFGAAASLLAVVGMLDLGDPASLAWVLLAAVMAAALYNIAIGGWLGGLLGGSGGHQLGAWFTMTMGPPKRSWPFWRAWESPWPASRAAC